MQGAAVVPLIGLILLAASASYSDVVVYDHFDDGVLDPAWTVEFEVPATGWQCTEAGSQLTVTAIEGHLYNQWSKVHLTRACEAHDDFALTCSFSWDSEDQDQAMQCLRVYLLDDLRGTVAGVSYADSHLADRGHIEAGGGGGSYSGPRDLPYSGSIVVRIQRLGSAISIFWGDDAIVQGTTATAVSFVRLSFWYFRYLDSFFGTESVDFLSVEAIDTGVAEQPPSWGLVKALYR
jgi:hypothetical protein